MGIATEAAVQATRATKLYAREMGGIASQATKAEAALVKANVTRAASKVELAALDTLALGAYGAQQAKVLAKGALATSADLVDRGLTRSAQFARGAALTGKMELRFAAQDTKLAALHVKSFAIADARQTAADILGVYQGAKGLAASGVDLVDRGLTRSAQFARGAVLTGKMEVKYAAQDAKALAQDAVASAQGALGNKVIKAGFKFHHLGTAIESKSNKLIGLGFKIHG